jgi:hypothetical protein
MSLEFKLPLIRYLKLTLDWKWQLKYFLIFFFNTKNRFFPHYLYHLQLINE